MQFKKILVPVDGSGTADNALRYGVEMAKTYGAQLFVIVVADIGEAAYPLMQVNLDRNASPRSGKKQKQSWKESKNRFPRAFPSPPSSAPASPAASSPPWWTKKI